MQRAHFFVHRLRRALDLTLDDALDLALDRTRSNRLLRAGSRGEGAEALLDRRGVIVGGGLALFRGHACSVGGVLQLRQRFRGHVLQRNRFGADELSSALSFRDSGARRLTNRTCRFVGGEHSFSGRLLRRFGQTRRLRQAVEHLGHHAVQRSGRGRGRVSSFVERSRTFAHHSSRFRERAHVRLQRRFSRVDFRLHDLRGFAHQADLAADRVSDHFGLALQVLVEFDDGVALNFEGVGELLRIFARSVDGFAEEMRIALSNRFQFREAVQGGGDSVVQIFDLVLHHVGNALRFQFAGLNREVGALRHAGEFSRETARFQRFASGRGRDPEEQSRAERECDEAGLHRRIHRHHGVDAEIGERAADCAGDPRQCSQAASKTSPREPVFDLHRLLRLDGLGLMRGRRYRLIVKRRRFEIIERRGFIRVIGVVAEQLERIPFVVVMVIEIHSKLPKRAHESTGVNGAGCNHHANEASAFLAPRVRQFGAKKRPTRALRARLR